MMVGSNDDVSKAMALIGSVEWLVLSFSDWMLIPIENIGE